MSLIKLLLIKVSNIDKNTCFVLAGLAVEPGIAITSELEGNNIDANTTVETWLVDFTILFDYVMGCCNKSLYVTIVG